MISKALMHTNLQIEGLNSKYTGKVREVYYMQNDLLLMVATDRLSAFDVVMPKGIPYKGQILNQIATQMLEATSDIVPNWLKASPDPTFLLEFLVSHLELKWLLEAIYQVMLHEYIKKEVEFCVVFECKKE